MTSNEAASDLRHSTLEKQHRALGAKMGAFAGWLMPIEYAGTLVEHSAVREAVGLFDVSHLGKVRVEGPGAFETIQRSLTNDLSQVAVGAAQYAMVLDDSGGIVDDLITYRVGDDRYLVVPNAANVEAVAEVLHAHAANAASIEIRDDLCLLAVQGPRSFELAGEILPEAPSLRYMRSSEASYGGQPMVVSRTGYTGERGFELFVPARVADRLWRELLERGARHGLRPCGLAARDTLRLEMGYPLHGNDIGADRTPMEAGLTWAVAMGKGDFPGREALARRMEEGVASRLWGLRMTGKLIPRPHYAVYVGDEQAGETTSGSFSPTLRIGIALAYLSPRERFAAGDRVDVDIRGRRGEAEVVSPPFVDRTPK